MKKASHLRALTRVREVFLDYFVGENVHRSTEESWHRYFDAFAQAARRNV